MKEGGTRANNCNGTRARPPGPLSLNMRSVRIACWEAAMDYRSRWAWVVVVTLVLALTGAWLAADVDGQVPATLTVPRP